MNILGYVGFVDIFLESSQNLTSLRGSYLCIYGLLLRSGYRMGIILGVV